MPEEIAETPEVEPGLEVPEGITGDELGLADDWYPDPESAEASEDATGAEEELPQESDEPKETTEEAAETVTPEDAETAPTGETETPAETEPAPATDNFLEYGDHKFGTREDVTQYLKTVEGRQRVTQAAHRDALDKNGAWINWSNDAGKLREQLAKIEGTEPSKVEVSDKKVTSLDGLNWQHLEQMVSEGKGMQALATMAHQFDKTLEARLNEVESRLGEQVAPITERDEAVRVTKDLMQSAETAMDDNGDLLWPEFNKDSPQYDPQFCQLFVQQWHELPATIAFDPAGNGIDLAYQRTKASMPAPEAATAAPVTPAAPKTPAQDMVRDEQGRFVKQTEAAATAVGGSGGSPPVTGEPAEGFAEAALLKSLNDPGDKDPVFGIRR